MLAPFTDFSAFMPACVPKKVPSRFIESVCLKFSNEMSSILPGILTPALLTSVVRLPMFDLANFTAEAQLCADVTSSSTNKSSSPYCPASAEPFSAFISPITTFAPSAINRFALAAPIPLAPPEIRAVLPASLLPIIFSKSSVAYIALILTVTHPLINLPGLAPVSMSFARV